MSLRPALAAAALLLPLMATPALAQSPDHGHAHVLSLFQADQLEYRQSKHGGSVNWDFHAWIGDDDEKLFLKMEGEQPSRGALEEAELQALYSWRISDFFDAQAGVRYDYRPGPQRGFAVFGVQGMAPYFIEVDAALFVSHKGEVSARLKGEYDLYITQSLILQPAAEINLAAQNVPERGIGAGISDFELGLRLRYEIVREFAPYVGVNVERSFGRTADFARIAGDSASDTRAVIGLRAWF